MRAAPPRNWRQEAIETSNVPTAQPTARRPYAHPYYWAASYTLVNSAAGLAPRPDAIHQSPDMIPTKTFCTRPLGAKCLSPTDQISRSCLARLRAGRHHFSRRGGRRSPARCGERLVAARADEIPRAGGEEEAPRIDAARRQALLKRRVEQLRKAGKHDAAVSTARRSPRSPNSGMGASI